MAITKKTIEQIAQENNIDISEAGANAVKDAYLKPQLNQLQTEEQKAISDTQTALKQLQNDYFNQYRSSQYEAQSRGLTGGLANLDANRLRMGLGQANSELQNALIQTQADINNQRSTAMANAEAYKREYLDNMLAKVSSLREADYAQRYQEWLDAQNRAMQEAQQAEAIRQFNLQYELNKANADRNYQLELEALNRQKANDDLAQQQFNLQLRQYEDALKQQQLANQYTQLEYLPAIKQQIYDTYKSMSTTNPTQASKYLADSIRQYSNLGLDQGFIDEIGSINKNYYTQLRKAQEEQNLQNLQGSMSSNLILGILNSNPIGSVTSFLTNLFSGNNVLNSLPQYNVYNAYNAYRQKQNIIDNIKNYENQLSNMSLPSWYRSYITGNTTEE